MRRVVAVTLDDEGVNVSFEGFWLRKDVDAAYRAMLIQLPKHLAQKKEEMKDGRAGEQQTTRRKARG